MNSLRDGGGRGGFSLRDAKRRAMMFCSVATSRAFASFHECLLWMVLVFRTVGCVLATFTPVLRDIPLPTGARSELWERGKRKCSFFTKCPLRSGPLTAVPLASGDSREREGKTKKIGGVRVEQETDLFNNKSRDLQKRKRYVGSSELAAARPPAVCALPCGFHRIVAIFVHAKNVGNGKPRGRSRNRCV